MNRLAFLMLPTLFAASTSFSLKPVRWSLVGGASPREVAAGRTVPITVQADIAKGWHIYSLTQQPGGPIPLRIAVQGAPDVSVRGLIQAPKPDKYFDKNFGMTTELYSGKPRFTIPVGITGRAAKGARRVEVTARYQVCSDKLCLPPRTDTVRVALTVAVRR
ncbi:MAG TPA: protein-disulfide reductase DsbD N-terminal domain-containing protein [Gemmatimonadaceae bacterium]|nr:protein-disulfide reductase DsbD N-terminal domain-containing protein [Gemmatimonadaceae bacterium]